MTLYTETIDYLKHHPIRSDYGIHLYESTSTTILVCLEIDAYVLIEIKEDPQEVKILLETRNKKSLDNRNLDLLDDLEKFLKEKTLHEL